MNRGLLRTLKLFAAMALGLLCPTAFQLQFLIRPLIMAMLWLAFIDIRFQGFRREHFLLLGANWLVGLAAWGALAPFDGQLATAALLIGLTPTATAAPVITGMLKGNVEFVAGSVLVTNVAAGLFLPLVLPALLGLGSTHRAIPMLPFLTQTAGIVLIPLALAQAVRIGAPAIARVVLAYRSLSFYAWLFVLFLATANASHFLRYQMQSSWRVAAMALLAAGLCTVNFALGKKIGGQTLSRETSQSLGQKNTMLTIWLALTFLNPLVALGPGFYVLCHNAYNAWQLARAGSKKDEAGLDDATG